MAWSAITDETDIEEATNGAGRCLGDVAPATSGGPPTTATAIVLNPRESCHIHITRTTTSPAEPWGIEVYGSLNGTNWGDIPLRAWRYEAADVECDFVVTGPHYITFKFLNVDASPNEKVKVNASWQTDGVAL